MTAISQVQAEILNTITQEIYEFQIEFLAYSTIHLTMREKEVYRPRFHPDEALEKKPVRQKSVSKSRNRYIM